MRVKSMKKPTTKSRSKRPIRLKRSTRLEKRGSAKIPPPRPQTLTAQTIVVVAMCVAGAAMLIAARQPSEEADVVAVEAPLEAYSEGRGLAPSDASVITPVNTPAAAGTARPHAAASVAKAIVPAIEPVTATTVESEMKFAAVELPTEAAAPNSLPSAPPAAASTGADIQGPPPVTITGCLQLEEGMYLLKDTAGEGAPKSRSWRSGFLKKRLAPVELVDAASTQQLSSYVGQRVAATGMLTNREMRVRSVQRVAAGCS